MSVALRDMCRSQVSQNGTVYFKAARRSRQIHRAAVFGLDTIGWHIACYFAIQSIVVGFYLMRG